MSMTMSSEEIAEFEEKSENVIDNSELEVSRQLSYEFAFQSFDVDLRKLLVQVTGQTDTVSVSRVKIKVVTKQAGIHRLADYTPRLKVLILDGSCVDSLRDLGSSLKHLEALSVVSCNLKSLDGLWGFRSLNSLVASDNSIKDPSPCSGVDKLAKLDLANNEIDDPYSFVFLRNCKHLRILDVAGNFFEDCKDIITSLVPQIRVLDGEEIESVDNRADSEEESDLTSEDEELIFFSGDEDNRSDLPKKEEDNDSALKKEAESERRLRAQELGAGGDEGMASGLNENYEKGFEKDDTKNRADERNLDSSSSSIFLMTHEFDTISIIDRSARNVGDYHHSLETTPSKLTSGRAVCGNLAASLRARNLSKNPFTLPAARASLPNII